MLSLPFEQLHLHAITAPPLACFFLAQLGLPLSSLFHQSRHHSLFLVLPLLLRLPPPLFSRHGLIAGKQRGSFGGCCLQCFPLASANAGNAHWKKTDSQVAVEQGETYHGVCCFPLQRDSQAGGSRCPHQPPHRHPRQTDFALAFSQPSFLFFPFFPFFGESQTFLFWTVYAFDVSTCRAVEELCFACVGSLGCYWFAWLLLVHFASLLASRVMTEQRPSHQDRCHDFFFLCAFFLRLPACGSGEKRTGIKGHQCSPVQSINQSTDQPLTSSNQVCLPPDSGVSVASCTWPNLTTTLLRKSGGSPSKPCQQAPSATKCFVVNSSR